MYLIGEGTRSVATGNGRRLGVGGELEDGALALGTRRDDENIGRVLNGDDSTRGQQQLLVRAPQVDDVHTWQNNLSQVKYNLSCKTKSNQVMSKAHRWLISTCLLGNIVSPYLHKLIQEKHAARLMGHIGNTNPHWDI